MGEGGKGKKLKYREIIITKVCWGEVRTTLLMRKPYKHTRQFVKTTNNWKKKERVIVAGQIYNHIRKQREKSTNLICQGKKRTDHRDARYKTRESRESQQTTKGGGEAFATVIFRIKRSERGRKGRRQEGKGKGERMRRKEMNWGD